MQLARSSRRRKAPTHKDPTHQIPTLWRSAAAAAVARRLEFGDGVLLVTTTTRKQNNGCSCRRQDRNLYAAPGPCPQRGYATDEARGRILGEVEQDACCSCLCSMMCGSHVPAGISASLAWLSVENQQGRIWVVLLCVSVMRYEIPSPLHSMYITHST